MDASQTIVFPQLAAGDSGDLDAFDDLLHPDAVVNAPEGPSTTGAEEDKAVWKAATTAMPDLRHWCGTTPGNLTLLAPLSSRARSCRRAGSVQSCAGLTRTVRGHGPAGGLADGAGQVVHGNVGEVAAAGDDVIGGHAVDEVSEVERLAAPG